jgi:hypothetical protein
MSHQINLLRIKAVHDALGSLRDDVVFVGGAIVSLYAERKAEELRPTDDIDILIELWRIKFMPQQRNSCAKLDSLVTRSRAFLGKRVIILAESFTIMRIPRKDLLPGKECWRKK